LDIKNKALIWKWRNIEATGLSDMNPSEKKNKEGEAQSHPDFFGFFCTY